MWWRLFEACSQIGYLTDVGWLGSKSQQKRYSDILVLLISISYQPRYYIYMYISILFADRVTRTYETMHQKTIIIYHMNLLRMSSSRRVVLLHEWWFLVKKGLHGWSSLDETLPHNGNTGFADANLIHQVRGQFWNGSSSNFVEVRVNLSTTIE